MAGAMGSNMYNSIFMPHGTRVLIITPTSFASSMNYLVNAPKDIATDYLFVEAETMSHDSEMAWYVDLDKLKHSLEQFYPLTN